MAALRNEGYYVEVAHSWEEAKGIIERYLTMKLLKFKKREDHEDFIKLIEKIRTRRFVVLSVDEEGNYQEHWHKMTDVEAVYGIELLKSSILYGDE